MKAASASHVLPDAQPVILQPSPAGASALAADETLLCEYREGSRVSPLSRANVLNVHLLIL